MARLRRLIAALWVIVAARAAWSQPAYAQDQDNVHEEQPFAVWLLTGVDVAQGRWRGSIRLGHLGIRRLV